MWIGGSGNSGFDGAFLVLQIAAFVIGLGVLAFGRRMGGATTPLVIAAAVIAIGSTVYWYVAYPPRSGIDGAGRLMVGVPALLINAVVLGIAAWRHLRR